MSDQAQSNETQSSKRSTPTEKMLVAAQKAAARHGVELPKGLAEDFEVCKEFLDKYLNLPSAKQVAYAQKISETKGIELPEDLLQNSRDLSAWIDANQK